ncbi:hypothetical protein AX15_007217 [Amanita polypyramis BW_CC]|nr:hypothetical protein AX15_007217 [Amanita polypyramis BW_CC]
MLKLLSENTIPREPSPSKQGENGFAEAPGDFSKLLVFPTGEKKEDGSDELVSVSDEALHRYRQAMYVLTQKDRPIPSLAQMNEAFKEPEDSTHIDTRIKKLKQQHLDDLQRLYSTHAAEYHEEILHRHRSKDEAQYLARGENNSDAIESYENLEKLYRNTRDAPSYELFWHDDIARMNHAYHQELLHLRQKRMFLREREEKNRKIFDAQFPRNIADWRTKSKDVQLRVARFLTGDTTKQDRMISEFGWAWRQVQPLKDDYSKNEEFQAEIRKMLDQLEVKDPRAKR